MESNWAAEHLQVIRTLMERSAIYRRALAPVMLLTGCVGLVAAASGWLFKIESPRAFIGYWVAISLAAVAGAFLLVRRQALKEGEPFWSPPTRRVTQALLPPLVAGFIINVIAFIYVGALEPKIAGVMAMLWLPLGWVVLYGCAIHADRKSVV